ncbi:MAG: hypothetical protein Q7R40_08640 [Phaeospirillum sp.]|nr:hypothetical protein [Phaeospirillum sp.]
MSRWIRVGVIAVGVIAAPAMGWCASSQAKSPPADAPIQAAIAVDNFVLVERAPVRNGFSPFNIEATGLLPAPRKRESFTPSEDEHFYTLRRTVERFLHRKEIPQGWFKSNEAKIAFESELSRFRAPDGVAYAVEGELVVHGGSVIPLGLNLTVPPNGAVFRYSAGLIVADQIVMMKEGLLDQTNHKAGWMVALRPSGADAAIPVRAVFAVRAEGGDPEANRKALATVAATLTSSSDGRPAVAERANDASEWLKPVPSFIRPGQSAAGGKAEKPAKADKEKKGGH